MSNTATDNSTENTAQPPLTEARIAELTKRVLFLCEERAKRSRIRRDPESSPETLARVRQESVTCQQEHKAIKQVLGDELYDSARQQYTDQLIESMRQAKAAKNAGNVDDYRPAADQPGAGQSAQL